MISKIDVLITRIYRLHYKRLFGRLSDMELSVGQPKILNYLMEHDGCIQRDLAKECCIEPASVSVVLNNMEKTGLLARCQCEENKRICKIYLTDLGREKQALIADVQRRFQEDCFEGFTEEEREQCMDYLTRIYKNLKVSE